MHIMSPLEKLYEELSYEGEVERIKWFHNDLYRENTDWTVLKKTQFGTYWLKEFPDQEVSRKVLFDLVLPIPADGFLKLLNPSQAAIRLKWDTGFKVYNVVDELTDGKACLIYMVVQTSSILANRSFLLFTPETKEIDWFGEKATVLIQKHAVDDNKAPMDGDVIRATNGGNFFIVRPDKDSPETKCRVFSLSNNNYNGNLDWAMSIPLLGSKFKKAVVDGVNQIWVDMVDRGYPNFIKE